ncbi:MAG: PEGA domain-containing protein [Spirochaetales bacterium]|nr:PEGA domain-containing protein [Spirochaetales bacterium]
MIRKVICLASCLVFFTLVSCASSSGDAFTTAAGSVTKKEDGDSSPAHRQTEKDASAAQPYVLSLSRDSDETDAGLIIESDPDHAKVYVNGRFEGHTPLILTDLSTDRYLIEVEKQKYYTYNTYIHYSSSSRQTLFINLTPITGYLSLEVNVPAAVFLEGDEYTAPFQLVPVPVGDYRITVRAFGFKHATVSARIQENEETSIAVNLEKAAFSAGDVRLERNTINPSSGGPVSSLEMTYTVNAPGTGTLRILQEEGTEVYRRTLGDFSSWTQREQISGTELKDLDDGIYRISLDLEGENGESSTLSSSFRIDSSLKVLPRTSLQGVSGLLFNPDTSILPEGMISAGSFIAAHQGNYQDRQLLFLPVHWSVRVPFPNAFEMSISATGVFLNDPELAVPFLFSAGIKKRLLPLPAMASPFRAAAFVSATYGDNTDGDFFANYPGVHAGTPLELSVPGLPLSVGITPQLSLSWRYPRYSSSSYGLYSWAYLKASLSFDKGPFSAGVSGSLRTEAFSEGFALGPQPFAAGAEVHFIPFSTGVAVSAYMFGEADTDGSFYINGGAGASLIF